jgi:hypothetical protein
MILPFGGVERGKNLEENIGFKYVGASEFT